MCKGLGDWNNLNRSIFDIGDSTLDFSRPGVLNFSVFVKTR